jgi:AcrR family transcriptional regulator
VPRQGLDRARVVAEAAALADAEGLEAVSLAALAARLGVRPPSLYKHVDGLEGLRAGIAVLAADEVGAVLGAAVAGRSGRDALEALGRAWVGYARAHPGRYALTVRAPDPADAAHVAAVERVLELIYATLRPLGLEGDAATHAIRVVRSALHGFCVLEATGGFGMPLALDPSLDRLLDVLAVGLGAD